MTKLTALYQLNSLCLLYPLTERLIITTQGPFQFLSL